MTTAPTYRTNQPKVPLGCGKAEEIEEEEIPSRNKTPEALVEWLQKRLTTSVVQGGKLLVKTESLEIEATQAVVQKLGSRAKDATSTRIASAVENTQNQQGQMPLYDCAVRISWFGRYLLDGRPLGESTGVIDIPEVSSVSEKGPTVETCTVKCFCEFRRWAGSHDNRGRKLEMGDAAAVACTNWGNEYQPRGELDDIETQLKDAVASDGVAKIIAKVKAVQQELSQLTLTRRDLSRLPDPTVELVEEEEVKATADVQAFIDKLTEQGKGNRYQDIFLKTLDRLKNGCESDAETEMKFDFCNLEDPDLANLIELMKVAEAQNQSLVKLDLSNNKIKDAGIQSLIMALAGGMLPQLMELNLKANAFTVVGSNMLRGLSLLRKKMRIIKE